MPTTAESILTFLEFIGFYCKFIANYLNIALPLTKAVKFTVKTYKIKIGKKVKKVVY
jgi:hypothetical protein